VGPLFFIIYLNDLPGRLNQGANPVIYADDTSILLTANTNDQLKSKFHSTLAYMIEWFSANSLALNMEKTNIMKFTTNYRQSEVFQIIHQNKIVMGVNNIKFLGLELDKHVSWKNHIQKLLSKLSSTCYLARRMYACCNLNTIKMIYFACLRAIMEYGIIFWGNSVKSKRIFQKQKRIIRIMTGTTARTSCRLLFPELQILTSASQYIFSLMRFLSSNLKIYKFNTSIHNLNTRHKLKLHMPAVRLIIY